MASSEGPAVAGSIERKPTDDEIDVFGLTHPGKVRKTNQDHFLLASVHKRVVVHLTSLTDVAHLPFGEERLAFFAVVADGVGGGDYGEEASRIALEAVMQYVTRSMQCYYQSDAREGEFIDSLQTAAMQSHAIVRERAEGYPGARSMATTLTLWMGVWPWIYLLQVGDSRYYIYRDGKLSQMTRDQTMAQALLDQGVFSHSEDFQKKWGHVLASAIGGPQTAPVVTRIASDWRNVHLMCSDGLTKHVPDERIAQRLGEMTSAKQACEALVQDALDGGGTDNITVIVGRSVPKGGAPAASP
jgi:serine/threonine protein phosphatase PrpC